MRTLRWMAVLVALAGVAFGARMDAAQTLLGPTASESLAVGAMFAAFIVFIGYLKYERARQDKERAERAERAEKVEKARAEREELRLRAVLESHAMRERGWMDRLGGLDSTLKDLAREVAALRGR